VEGGTQPFGIEDGVRAIRSPHGGCISARMHGRGADTGCDRIAGQPLRQFVLPGSESGAPRVPIAVVDGGYSETTMGAAARHSTTCGAEPHDGHIEQGRTHMPPVASRPPSTRTVSPVSHCASSETRKPTVRATSAGSPMRPIGYLLAAAAGSSPTSTPANDVPTTPGATALTRIPG